ncbi:MAG: hypothetical protein KIT16_09555 [Rhodospirillaceae bacterium]|nr:hypothetical protein [Rhodospirillaceae bacterium]
MPLREPSYFPLAAAVEDYYCGRAAIDADTAMLMEHADRLYRAIAEEGDGRVLRQRLFELLSFIFRHSLDEERVLDGTKAPSAEAHRIAHDAVFADIGREIVAFATASPSERGAVAMRVLRLVERHKLEEVTFLRPGAGNG